MSNQILAKAASAIIARAKALGYTYVDVIADESMTYDMHWYCGQYAVNPQCVKYRQAWDRIASYIEKRLPAEKPAAEEPEGDADYEETVKNEYLNIVSAGLRA